jgi:hypothetical protein
MPNITIQVPDDKMDFFMELMNNLGLEKVEKEKTYILSERQIQLVEEAIKEMDENPESLLDWEEEQHNIDWDAC